MTPLTLIRNLVASALSFVAAYGLYTSLGSSKWHLLALPLGLLFAAGLLIHLATLGPQVLARAVWWANLALGAVLALSGNGKECTAGGILALACGGALLIAGRRSLGEANTKGRAIPGAFRSMLLLLMIFALADAQTFLLFGSIGLIEQSSKLGSPVIMLALGLAYVVGFAGLYRLEVRGAIFNVLVSVVAFVLVVLFEIVGKDELRVFLAVLAVVHVVVATPVIVAALSGKDLPGLSPALRSVLATVVIVGVMLASAVSFARGSRW